MRRLILASALVLSACGSSPTQPAPVVTMQGTWTGTMQSDNWRSAAVSVSVLQTDVQVSGSWKATDGSDWFGQISGTFTGDSFSGTFTISTPKVTGQPDTLHHFSTDRCSGTSLTGGSVTLTAMSLQGQTFAGNCTELPANLRWSLHR